MTEYITFVQNNPLLFIGLVVVIAFIVKIEIARLTRKYNQINTNEAVQLLNKDETVVVDVREDKEVQTGIINGAKHIPLGSLSDQMSQLNNAKDKPILIYCRSGNRSSTACQKLTQLGFSDVYNLAGGIMSWESANLPIHKQ